MASDDPVYFTLVLDPIAKPRPSDAAEVLISLDDFARFGFMAGIASHFGERPPIPGRSPDSSWDYLLSLGVSEGEQLTAKRIEFGSPLEIVTQIPWGVAGAAGGLWAFVTGIERLWNLPNRVRVESQRLAADEQTEVRRYWAERLAAEEAEVSYREYRRELTALRRVQGPPRYIEPAFEGRSGVLTDRLPEPRGERSVE